MIAKRLASGLLFFALFCGCKSQQSGTVITRDWTRTIEKQREECRWERVRHGFDEHVYYTTERRCYWRTLRTWTKRGGAATPPAWPETEREGGAAGSDIRYQLREEYRVALRGVDGGEAVSLTVDEGDYAAMVPGSAWAVDVRLGHALTASRLSAETP